MNSQIPHHLSIEFDVLTDFPDALIFQQRGELLEQLRQRNGTVHHGTVTGWRGEGNVPGLLRFDGNAAADHLAVDRVEGTGLGVEGKATRITTTCHHLLQLIEGRHQLVIDRLFRSLDQGGGGLGGARGRGLCGS